MAPNPALRLGLTSGPLRIHIAADDFTRVALSGRIELRSDIWIAPSPEDAQVVLVHAANQADLSRLEGLDLPAVVLVADPDLARIALARGARGAIAADAEASSVIAALIAAISGLTVIDTPSVERNRELSNLTAREFEVLEFVARGCSNRDIAGLLEISEHTVKFHVGGLLNKLNAATRAEAVAIAAREQLL